MLAVSAGHEVNSLNVDWIPRVGKTKHQPPVTTTTYPLQQAQTDAYQVIQRIKMDVGLFRQDPDRLYQSFPANPMSMLCSDKYCPRTAPSSVTPGNIRPPNLKTRISCMSKDVATTNQMINPYAIQAGGNRLPDGVNAGTVTIEVQRAIAEVQAKLMIAKSMPRDPVAAWEKVMKACSLPGMAEAAFYSYKRGGQEVTGPSIRLAEALASAWGNIDYGMRELSNKDGVTELEAYAWDLKPTP